MINTIQHYVEKNIHVTDENPSYFLEGNFTIFQIFYFDLQFFLTNEAT